VLSRFKLRARNYLVESLQNAFSAELKRAFCQTFSLLFLLRKNSLKIDFFKKNQSLLICNISLIVDLYRL
ncbi:hypothetical protein, partial [Acinetobacter indicus]